MPKDLQWKGYNRIAGNLCLDFTNTLGGARGRHTTEFLTGYGALLDWGQAAGVVSETQAQTLETSAGHNPERAHEVWERAVALREAIFRVVVARKIDNDDLSLISREAGTALSRARLYPARDGFVWDWPPAALDLDRVVWPIARAAAELLTSPARSRIRECASETCSWLFLDRSKNGSRRWCDMKDCGNREKVRRHRA